MLATASSSYVAMQAEMRDHNSRHDHISRRNHSRVRRSNPRIVVWVANRDRPIVGRTASFGLVDGNLKLSDEEEAIWSTNVSSSSTRLAKLLDSGNLVLMEGESFLWQSFQNPTDTFLPGMRMIGNFKLTSWASQDDPKQGNFTFQMDQEDGNSNYEVIHNLSPYWKSGVYGKFIQGDQMFYVISFLLSNFTSGVTATLSPAGTSPTSAYINITLPSDYNYSNTRLVMNYDGQIQYFRQGNGSKPVWCLPGFKPAQPENWNSGGFFDGCLRKSSTCAKNSNDRADDFLSLKMMRAKGPDGLFSADNEEQCRQKCLDVCSCQAYSFHEDQHQTRVSSISMCYTWSDDLDNIQELAQDGHDLYVRVQLSDIESTRRSCKTCGTNLVPYPLSTGWSCGDPLYFAFSCVNETAQLYFERPQGRYRVTSVNPEARTFTIQVENGSDCASSGQMEINLQLNQSSPFHDSIGILFSVNCSPASGGGSSQKTQKVKLVYIIAPTGAAIFVIVFGALFYMRRQPGSMQGSRETTQENHEFRLYDSEKRIKMWMDSRQFKEEDKKGIDVPFFDLEIILQATNNFSDENKLGRGGFGPVYKATFPGGQEIAVKRLLSGSGQGLEEFKSEVVLIAKLQHRNLVRLVGYCVKGDEKMLLYEYMPNKSLDSFIFDRTRLLSVRRNNEPPHSRMEIME
ncbi:hypothetical protein NL676_017566 [Syzygium grande]|nr:hypothetical protein NL676_017566 [Syzygium grande]